MTLLSEALKPELEEELWLLKSDLCRCCHVEGSFNDLNFQFFSDILKESLNINLSPIDGILMNATSKICDKCIQKVLDVNTFRAQVLACEERFHNLCAKNLIKVTPLLPEVKIEDDEAAETRLKSENGDDDWPSDDALPCNNSKDEEPLEEKPTKAELRKAMSTRAKAKAKGDKARKAKAKPPEARAKPPEARKKARAFVLRDSDFSVDGSTLRCAHCDKTFTTKPALIRHAKRTHYKMPKYTCPYCDQDFMTAAPFVKHKFDAHKVDDTHKCNACKGVFNTRNQLRKHINTFHMLGTKHKCADCDYETYSVEGLYKHRFKHRTVKEFHCRFCMKSFMRKATLELHERIHTGDRRKVCQVCNQAFVQKASLNYHMAKYHPEVNF